jgi:hypothetical protein
MFFEIIIAFFKYDLETTCRISQIKRLISEGKVCCAACSYVQSNKTNIFDCIEQI